MKIRRQKAPKYGRQFILIRKTSGSADLKPERAAFNGYLIPEKPLFHCFRFDEVRHWRGGDGTGTVDGPFETNKQKAYGSYKKGNPLDKEFPEKSGFLDESSSMRMCRLPILSEFF